MVKVSLKINSLIKLLKVKEVLRQIGQKNIRKQLSKIGLKRNGVL